MGEAAAKRDWMRFGVVTAVMLAAVAAILALQPGSADLILPDGKRMRFSLQPALDASAVIQLHLVTVVWALVVGPIQFILPKGTRLHRALGWTWVAAMATTAISSLFIREVNDGAFSPIHVFSAWTLVSLPLAIFFARRGNVRAHQSTMIGLYIGLLIAGALAAAPGRVVWDMFVG